MDHNQTDRLKAIFHIALRLPTGADPKDIRRVAVESWDSLAQVTIVSGIESEFGLSLDARDIERITSFHAARLLVEEKTR